MSQRTVTIEEQPIDDGLHVLITGEVDFGNSPELRVELKSILGSNPKRLIVDLAGVPYMDSSGVATLVEVLQALTKTSSKLVLCNLQPKVSGIFQIARLDLVFNIVEDFDTALAV